MHPLPCSIEAPPAFAARARYALDMLLRPLRIQTQWVDRDALPPGGLYYGTPDDALPSGVIQFALKEETPAFFEDCIPYDESLIRWLSDGPVRIPVLFGGGAEDEGDLIASAFFWLSGWQEFTSRSRDAHGRFTYGDSLQSRLDTAYIPAVDAYRELLAKRLEAHGIPVLPKKWEDADWAFCPTHDIDYLRKWRPGMVYRELVEYFVANHRSVSIGERWSRLSRVARDILRPGDVFREAIDGMIERVRAAGGKATYFIKTGAHGPNDVYYRTTDPFLKKTIRKLDALDFEVGLHPSYHAHDHAGYLKEEKALLEAVCARNVGSVRQHFLRYAIPATPRLHEEAGFRVDSTLGFSDHEGFRHATCHPFRLFDVQLNKPLDVWEMPLCVMDGVVFNRRNMSVDEGVEAVRRLIRVCKKYGGVCVGLWHNTLWDETDFPGWGAHFERSLEAVLEGNGRIDSLQGALDIYLSETSR